jgi:hypothetical protein
MQTQANAMTADLHKSLQAPAESGASVPAASRRRRRTGKKRLHFRPPQAMPRGVRELWQSATSEEQQSAHRSCVQILALWLGKRTREDVAASLSLPPLRVWQLSQQALAGMLAGLLIQPKSRRGRQECTTTCNPDDPRVLNKRIEELSRKNAELEQLVRLVAQLPTPASTPAGGQPASSTSAMNSASAAKKRAARADGRAEAASGSSTGSAQAEAR